MTLDDFKRIPLGFVPTPIEPLERLGTAYGITLTIKRDDFTGFGAGGNKVRKLEFLLADAIDKKANVRITTGGHQSNHARMVAAACKHGMTSVLVLRGDAPKEYQGNLLLDCLFGARFEFLDPDDYFHLIDGRMEAQAEAARAKRLVPYIIPLGGANPLGALGYVRAAEEIAGQLAASTMKAPDIIVAPVGSGGTVAGLQVGCGKHLPGTRIVGISVSRDRAWFQKQIARMASECAELLDWPDRWSPDDIWIEDGYVGPGYGKASDGGIAAIREAACTEGLLLDPIYTGKAMHGLKDLCQRGAIKPGERVMFLHCGGSPALYPFAKLLTGT